MIDHNPANGSNDGSRQASLGISGGAGEPLETPCNGIAGLKHWRHDAVAGLLVSLVSLPLSLGIAIASGAPPISGLFSAIIAGLLMPFLGGSYVTISGPAAGLAPALLVIMTALGAGDRAVGYPLLLGVIAITGAVQIVLSILKAARFSALFPAAVVEGMLAAIGCMIIAKELPHLFGHPFHHHEFFGILLEAPAELLLMNPKVVLLGCICLVLIFVLSNSRFRRLAVVPPPLVIVLVGIVLGRLLQINDPALLIQIPADIMSHGIVLPNFGELFSNHTLWLTAATGVLTLTLIDGVESLATAAAVDKLDRFHRKSEPNRVLRAMGISNICSSLAGGLTIIPGGVKSSVCVLNGGRTLWANFYNAIFLIIYLFAAKGLITLIPLSALAAILIHTGYRMCEIRVWRHIAHVGREQLLVFACTVVATLYTDLLVGIATGMLVKLLLGVTFTWPAERSITDQPVSLGHGLFQTLKLAADLFRNPVVDRELRDDGYHLSFGRPLVCFNAHFVNQELAAIPPTTDVILHISNDVTLIDHTSCDSLIRFAREYKQSGRGHVEVVGLDRMWARSSHDASMRHKSLALARGPIRSLFNVARFVGWRTAIGIADRFKTAEAGQVYVADGFGDLARFSLSKCDNAHRDPYRELTSMSLWPSSRRDRIPDNEPETGTFRGRR